MRLITFTDRFDLMYPIGQNLNEAYEYIDYVGPFLQREIKDQPFNIWCMGSSGAILATLLTTKFPDNDIDICYVSKEKETSHRKSWHQYKTKERLNIILDDFVRTGSTMTNIWEAMQCTCDILVVANFLEGEPWLLPFRPKLLITDKHSSEKSWTKLKPTIWKESSSEKQKDLLTEKKSKEKKSTSKPISKDIQDLDMATIKIETLSGIQ